MENQQNNKNVFGLQFSDKLRKDLGSAAVWAKIAAVISFITAGVSVLSSFFSGSVPGSLVSAVFSVFIALFLYRFADNTLKGVADMNQQHINDGLRNLATYFKIYGVICIIVLSLFALMIVIFTLVAAFK
jgi:amino acid transporter